MFRFTIRDVLWLTVVVAVGLAVFLIFRAERIGLIQKAQRAEEDAQYATEKLLNATEGRPSRLRVQSNESAEPNP